MCTQVLYTDQGHCGHCCAKRCCAKLECYPRTFNGLQQLMIRLGDVSKKQEGKFPGGTVV